MFKRRDRWFAGPPEVGQGAGERDVVDVVTGGLGVRPVLAPSGHPSEHQLRIACEALGGPEAEPLHHAGPEPLDQSRRPTRRDRAAWRRRRGASGRWRCCGGRAAGGRRAALVGRRPAHRTGPFHPIDLGAHVGEHHRGERAGSDAGEFDDPVTLSGPVMSVPHSRPDDRTVVRTLPAIASTSTGHSGRGRSWPMSDDAAAVVTRGSARRCAHHLPARSGCRRGRGSRGSGTSRAGERRRPVAARVDRRQLTLDTLRVERTIERRRPPRSWTASSS